MKWYPYIIIFSTVLCSSHFFVPDKWAWYVYDYTTSFADISVLMAFVLYKSTPFEKIGVKLICAVYFLLSIISTIVLIANNDHRSSWLPVIALGVTILLTLLKAPSWRLSDVKSEPISNFGVFVVFKRPSGFWPWIASLFGFGVGSLSILVNGHRYYMSKHFRCFKKAPMVLKETEFAFRLQIHESAHDALDYDLSKLVGEQFRPISNNCVTAIKPVLREYGVNVRYLLPSRYFKEFIR